MKIGMIEISHFPARMYIDSLEKLGAEVITGLNCTTKSYITPRKDIMERENRQVEENKIEIRRNIYIIVL